MDEKNNQKPNHISQDGLYELVLDVLHSRMNKSKSQNALPHPDLIFSLLDSIKTVLDSDPVLLYLDGDFTVIGDIHGNIDDLLRIFEKFGYPPTTQYLFLGDYVDRGANSIEVVVLLYSLKLLFPKSIYLLRGNHECREVSYMYGFKNECGKRLPKGSFGRFISTFSKLPFCAIVNKSIICVHGGISPKLYDLKSFSKLHKLNDPAGDQMACDIIWSDPQPGISNFKPSERGYGFLFGQDALNEFLDRCGLELLIRSHESCEDGFEWPFDNTEEPNPDEISPERRILTIFSTSDYCGDGNKLAVLSIKTSDCKKESFKLPFVTVMNPLIGKSLLKRRVIIPQWALEHDFTPNSQ